MSAELTSILQIMGPAIAVYAAIRADLAALKIRMDHLERDFYNMEKKA